MKKQNRTRDVQIIVRVTPDEKEKIIERMKSIPIKDLSKYGRKMLLNGLIINLDLTQFHELANEVNKIGVNINQAVKIANANGNIAPTEIAELQGGVDAIWQLLKSSLSKIQSINL